MSEHAISFTLNGHLHEGRAEARTSLADHLRQAAGHCGVHLGCEHGGCGACTVIVDGKAVRACLMLAVQAQGCAVRTVEGLAASDGTLHRVQQVLREEHALQCGFCTPGIAMTLAALLEGETRPDAQALEQAIGGHLCRCTGYQGLRRAAHRLAGDAP